MKLPFLLAPILLLAVALQYRGEFIAQTDYPIPDLQAKLANLPEGWTAEDLPIGDTELLRALSEKTLRYDTYIFRRYRRANIEFTVYAAYWSPGKHPPQMIAQHTPDMCWTLNGMICEEMRFNLRTTFEEGELWPAQWRKFKSPSGQIIYTMFWHLVGERPFDYGNQFYSLPDPITFWVEALKFAVGKRKPQFFIRLTSNVPPEQIWNEEAVQGALKGLAHLGLARRDN
jgi:hypothetical protein